MFVFFVDAAEAAGMDIAAESTPTCNAGASSLQTMLVPAKNREVFERFFSSWIVSTFTPAARVDHPDLARALGAVGVKPPARRSIYGAHLDALYENTLESVSSTIREQKFVAVTMDGWKKMAAEQGAPLVTINFLLADGGSIFFKVC
jgi:hypothetical protein